MMNRNRKSLLSYVFYLMFIFTSISPVLAEKTQNNVLQRLFFSESERTSIDKVRSQKRVIKTDVITDQKKPVKISKVKNGDKTKRKSANKTVVIDGYIQREDGKNVVWFNNTSTLSKSDKIKHLKIKSRSIITEGVGIVSRKKNLRLKPGQVLDINTGTVKERYKIVDSSATVKVENQ